MTQHSRGQCIQFFTYIDQGDPSTKVSLERIRDQLLSLMAQDLEYNPAGFHCHSKHPKGTQQRGLTSQHCRIDFQITAGSKPLLEYS